ncbi:MAG: plasmid pRiA4b ORF-3-like protein [Sporomusa sp.]|jgi:hypothetical protein|nr:plasmid pRiA4b ORF-3-like protein [Sporomusa sp.]MDF2876607.1 plasmid pRiA4b ORF-3-like protein [Sporomusa sp.]
MLVQCTKKLFDELKIKPIAATNEESLFSWHANIITVNRRKTVVLVNDSNRYIIVLHGMKAKDFKNFNELIIHSIRETLLAECIQAEIVEQFIQHSPELIYAKTKDRTTVARMNKACETVYFYADELQSDTINQSRINRKVGTYLVSDDSHGFMYPYESLYKDLAVFANTAIIACQAVELKIMLSLSNHRVWRHVIVPWHITFHELHKVLQISFNWKDYHLHDFFIFDGDEPILNLVCSEDAFEYPNTVPMKLETGSKLSDYIPKYSRIKYNYDFGDDWQHYIEVLNMVENYQYNYPICIGGEGNAPPEDVGGEGGYDKFLAVIADPKHPEHADMVKWAAMQWYQDFDVTLVNRRLKDSLRQ